MREAQGCLRPQRNHRANVQVRAMRQGEEWNESAECLFARIDRAALRHEDEDGAAVLVRPRDRFGISVHDKMSTAAWDGGQWED